MQESHGRVKYVSVSLMLVYPKYYSPGPDVSFMMIIMIIPDKNPSTTNYPIHNVTM